MVKCPFSAANCNQKESFELCEYIRTYVHTVTKPQVKKNWMGF